ncbi:MAG: hypothetical protein JWQ75_2176 [Pseudarthrobacter sp.]|nr:hypothetical protein [Pseudarthrobacter sp.]
MDGGTDGIRVVPAGDKAAWLCGGLPLPGADGSRSGALVEGGDRPGGAVPEPGISATAFRPHAQSIQCSSEQLSGDPTRETDVRGPGIGQGVGKGTRALLMQTTVQFQQGTGGHHQPRQRIPAGPGRKEDQTGKTDLDRQPAPQVFRARINFQVVA